MCASHADLNPTNLRRPYTYALYVCLICMPYEYALYVCLICMPCMYALWLVRLCGGFCAAREGETSGGFCAAREGETGCPSCTPRPQPRGRSSPGRVTLHGAAGRLPSSPAQPRPPASSCGQCVRTGCGGPGRGVWRGGCARLSAWAARGPALRDLTCAPACWCMPYMYALFVCLVCIPDMHALYVQAIPERIDHAGGVKGHSRTSPG